MTAVDIKNVSAPNKQTIEDGLLGIIAIILSMSMVSISFGMMTSLVPLYAKVNGVNYFLIGVISAMTSLGALVIILVRSMMTQYIGSFRAIYLSMSLAAISIFLLPLTSEYTWLLLRFIQGTGLGLLFLTCDTWIQRLADPQRRGRITAIYITMQGVCVGLGVFIISKFEVTSIYPFIIAALLFLVAIMPLLLIKDKLSVTETGTMQQALRGVTAEPQLFLAAFLFFALQATAISLLPLLGLHRGYTTYLFH